MKSTGQTPCPFWAEKLAATHPDDLTPFDRLALETHIASCPACAAVRAEYEAMGSYLSQLPPVEPL
ncbi:MAG TPA: zf-HC2 domain-containing protein, partial [Ktedonobacteraceae bacterium]|nr:zf-HC2 domain-containing protein [Ktedonobacteraceae bacterium]